MKGKTLSALGALAALVGVVIIIFSGRVTKSEIIIWGGVLFVAAGVLNLIIYGHDQRTGGISRVLNQLANAAAIVLGICLLVFPSTFMPLIAFIFGLLIAVYALWMFFMLAIGARPHQLPGWLYVFPLLLTVACVYIFVRSTMPDSLLLVVTGASLAVAGAGSICMGACLGMARRALAAEPKGENKPESKKEAEAIEAPKEAAAPQNEASKGEESEK